MAGQPQWQRVGENTAEAYERYLVPAVFASWAPTLIELANVQAGERVLDVACGTGVVARLAAERVGGAGRAVGLDVNAAMLEVAQGASPASGATIEWCKASATAMPLPNAGFDVVLCQQGLQQFPDRPAALAEMRRVLASPGRLAAAVWSRVERCPGNAALVAALERHVSVTAANNRRAPHALGDPEELTGLVRGAGFRDVAVRTVVGMARFPSPEKLVEYFLAGTPLSTFGDVTDQARAALDHDVRVSLKDYVDASGLAVPMEAHLVVAYT